MALIEGNGAWRFSTACGKKCSLRCEREVGGNCAYESAGGKLDHVRRAKVAVPQQCSRRIKERNSAPSSSCLGGEDFLAGNAFENAQPSDPVPVIPP